MKTSGTIDAVEHAIRTRRSIRGFTPQAVSRATLEHLLRIASCAPSGSNIQPWRVYVLMGPALQAFCSILSARHDAGEPTRPEYEYYPGVWASPYLDRRRKAGWGLYQLAGVARGDRDAAHRQRARNFNFFGASVGLVFTLDRSLGQGAWLETGMFMQNLMIAARAHGLDTCAQAAIAGYPDSVRSFLRLRENELVLCGMALGYADRTEPTNNLRTEREDLDVFTTFVDEPGKQST